MEALSAALLLVLFTLGNATPLTTVTQVPRTEEDVFREAVTDGFIMDHPLLIFQTTPPPNDQTTDQPRSTTEGPEEGSGGESSEGSAMGESSVAQSTIQPTFSPATAALPTPGIVVMEITESTILLNELLEYPTEPSEAIGAVENLTLTDLQGWGSSDTEDPSSIEIPTTSLTPTTSDADIDLSHLSSTTNTTLEAYIEQRGKPRMLGEIPDLAMFDDYEREPLPLEEENPNSTPNGHVTPDWIIIVGFLVGLGTLVLILVAIATRDKWNGPNQFNQTAVTLTSADQQRAIEMEEFIHREHPQEDGKDEEYTAIPLHELPDTYAQ